MPVLFESKYIRSRELFKEIFFYYNFRRFPRIVLLVIMGVLLAVNLFFAFILPSQDNDLNIAGCIVAVIFFLAYFVNYQLLIRLCLKREKEISSQSSVTYTSCVTEKSLIHSSSSGSRIEIDLSKIRKAFQTENYILLMSEARLMYSFNKNDFTVGNVEDFLQFLRSKGYKI